ncbi:hypothetical protein ACS0TY_020163 [Phlomoides rotata]
MVVGSLLWGNAASGRYSPDWYSGASGGRYSAVSTGPRSTGCPSYGTVNGCPWWHLSSIGVVKFNVDATVFAESQHIELGMVARDDSGHFVVGRTMVFRGFSRRPRQRLWGGFEVLLWDLGFTDIVVEMDAKNVQDAILKEIKTDTIFVQFCVELSELFQRCIFSYVPRSANSMT